MRYRPFTSLFTAAALVLAPTAALAQEAPQPAPSREAGLQYADSDDDDDDNTLWYILGGAAALLLIVLLFLDDDDEEDFPVSP